LAWSVAVSTQAAPQALAGAVHTGAHLLAAHTSPVTQAWPQEPQCPASVVVSTQVEPHAVVVPGHAHWLIAQTNPDAHALAQAPQLLGSLVVSTQLAPHGVRPAPQTMAHAPAEHFWPVPHG
jgi:hypothetical protein